MEPRTGFMANPGRHITGRLALAVRFSQRSTGLPALGEWIGGGLLLVSSVRTLVVLGRSVHLRSDGSVPATPFGSQTDRRLHPSWESALQRKEVA